MGEIGLMWFCREGRHLLLIRDFKPDQTESVYLSFSRLSLTDKRATRCLYNKNKTAKHNDYNKELKRIIWQIFHQRINHILFCLVRHYFYLSDSAEEVQHTFTDLNLLIPFKISSQPQHKTRNDLLMIRLFSLSKKSHLVWGNEVMRGSESSSSGSRNTISLCCCSSSSEEEKDDCTFAPHQHFLPLHTRYVHFMFLTSGGCCDTHLRTTSRCLLRTCADSCMHIPQLQDKRDGQDC